MRAKPRCKKCGADHWYFVKCADASSRNEVESRNATVTQLNATPVWRSGNQWGQNRLTSLDVTPGTNTFWQRRDDDEPEAA